MMFRAQKCLDKYEYGNMSDEFPSFDLDGGYIEDRNNLCVSLPDQL